MAGAAPKFWLDLPFRELSKENVRAEAAAEGMTLRELMRRYYQRHSLQAMFLACY
jgi:hypothetical protein